ncbi:MAG TPA: hypothetical protein VGG10_22065 [Rhizomicrobium sp.]|jgi:hypothetical protein
MRAFRETLFVVLRLISLVLIAFALMLLGADLVSTLEKGGEITVRSLADVWALFDRAVLMAFRAWMSRSLPSVLVSFAEAVLRLPGWGFFGVIGVIIAFLSGRHHPEAK